MSKSNSKKDVWPHPASFPAGSDESRAAARALIEERETGVERIQIVSHIPDAYQDNSQPHIYPWTPMTDGGFVRVVYMPPNIDEVTRRRILAAP